MMRLSGVIPGMGAGSSTGPIAISCAVSIIGSPGVGPSAIAESGSRSPLQCVINPVLNMLADEGVNGHSIHSRGRSSDIIVIDMELGDSDMETLHRVLISLLKLPTLNEIRHFSWIR